VEGSGGMKAVYTIEKSSLWYKIFQTVFIIIWIHLVIFLFALANKLPVIHIMQISLPKLQSCKESEVFGWSQESDS